MKAFPPLKILFIPAILLWLPMALARIPMLFTRGLVVGPLITLVWRSRCYLADAVAVQLTRNPDGLARALERVGAQATRVPGGEWAGYLFIVAEGGAGGGGEAERGLGSGAGDPHPAVERRVRRLRAMGARPDDVQVRPRRRAGLAGVMLLASFLAFIGSLLGAALGLAFLLGGGISLMFTAVVLTLLARLIS